jgi:chromosome segregation ATPase
VHERIEQQLARQGDVDALAATCDQVDLRVGELQQRLETVTGKQQTLGALGERIDQLSSDIGRIAERHHAARQDEGALQEQEVRLSTLVAESRSLGAELAGRATVLRTLNDDLNRAFDVKRDIVDELAQVRHRQDEVASVFAQTEEHKRQLEQTLENIRHRAEQAIFAEQRVAGIEGRFGQLDRLVAQLDDRMRQVTERGRVVDGVRQEVGTIHQIAERARSDMAGVAAQHADVVALKHLVDRLLGRVDEAKRGLALVDTRRLQIEEVLRRTEGIAEVVEDVRLKLDLVSEQRTIVDHAIHELARLDGLIVEARAAERSLQRERQLAERIKRGTSGRDARRAGEADESRTA